MSAIRMTPADVMAETVGRIAAQLAAGDPIAHNLVHRAQDMAPLLLRDLDPRVPPEALAQGITAMASDSLALVLDLYPDEPLPAQVAIMANALSAIGYALQELA